MEAGPLLRSCWVYRHHLWHAGGSHVFSGDPAVLEHTEVRGQLKLSCPRLGSRVQLRRLKCVQLRPWSFRTHRGQKPALAFQPK